MISQSHFADLLDSMGLVEFLLVVARDYGTTPEAIEACVGRTFGTIAELAAAMQTAGLAKLAGSLPEAVHSVAPTTVGTSPGPCWLGATAVRLPDAVQPAAQLNALLHRPPGWLERHAGLEGRCTWNGQDPLTAAAEAGQECLQRSGVRAEEVGTLLVTAEAPSRYLPDWPRPCTIGWVCGRIRRLWKLAAPAPASWRPCGWRGRWCRRGGPC